MSGGQQEYDNLNQYAHDEVQSMIDAQQGILIDTVKDRLLVKIDALKAAATDPAIRNIFPLTETLEQLNAVNTANDAVAKTFDAAVKMNTLSCGDYESGPNGLFSNGVKFYQATSDAAIANLQAASAVLGAIALVFPPAAIAAGSIGLLGAALEHYQDVVSKILAELDGMTALQADVDSDLNIYNTQNPPGDCVNLLNAYAQLPHATPQHPGPSTPPPSPTPPSSGGNPFSLIFDPLVLDLDRDGVELTPRGDPSVFWDADGDGSGHLTTWVDPDDGFLARDLDHNGRIETQAELFGNADRDALTDLALADSNCDGRIDAGDAIWGDLRVWRDLDHDGVTDDGELLTLAEAGIVRFDLTRGGGNGSNLADGQAVGFASFVTSDGALHEMAAVNFLSDAFQSAVTLPPGVTISDEAMALPQLHAMGQVVDLRLAMTLDDDLRDQVQVLRDTGAAMSGPAFHQAFEELLWSWTGIDPGEYATPALFRAAFINAVLQTNPAAGTGLLSTQEEGIYQELVDSLALRFVIEVAHFDADAGAPSNAFTPFLAFIHQTATGQITGFPQDVAAAILDALPGDREAAMDWLGQTVPLLSSLQWEFYARDQTAFRDALTEWFGGIADLGLRMLAVDLGSAAQVTVGTAGSDAIHFAHNHYISVTDSDVMVAEGGAGNDTFSHDTPEDDGTGIDVAALIYAQGDGDDIMDVAGADHILHRIYLRDINSADAVIRMGADGMSPIITFRNGGSITFQNVTDTGFSLQIYFADGVVSDQFEIISDGGTLANETITGTNGDDQLDGGAGADVIEGLTGEDTYHYFTGSGRDTVVEGAFGGSDTLFLHDHLAADLKVENINGDAVLTFKGVAGERITLDGQFGFGFFAQEFDNFVETIRFADGSTMTAAELVELLYSGQTTNGDDAITGTSVAETFHLGKGSDTISGGGGADVYIRDADKSGADVIDGAAANLVLEGLTQAQVSLSRSGANLVFDLPGSADLTVIGQFDGLGFTTVQRITFGDGSYLTSDRIAALFTPVMTGATGGTGGGDTITGTAGSDALDGKGGGDLLQGGLGGDTYYWRKNQGSDVIDDQGNGAWVETDRLVIKDAVEGELTFARLQNGDLLITNTTTGRTLTVTQHFFGTGRSIEEIRLDGGVVLTLAEINARAVLLGSAAGDTLTGTAQGEALSGLDGDDLIDALTGDDTLIGGTGNDTLAGREGSDTYVFGLGDGQDTINDSYTIDAVHPDGDTLRLTGVTLAQLQFDLLSNTIGDDLLIHVGTGGDTVLIKEMFTPFIFDGQQDGIWRILLDDGTVLDRNEIRALAEIRGTAGDDFIEGTTSDDIIEMGAGNDTVTSGGGGDDTFTWGEGRDDDQLFLQSPAAEADFHTLVLDGLTPGEVVLARQPNDDLTITVTSTGEVLTITGQFKVTSDGVYRGVGTIQFGDNSTMERDDLALAFPKAGGAGDDFVGGGFGHDVLIGGEGSDTLDGAQGSDLYLWTTGDGDDIIQDSGLGAADSDVLYLTDLMPGDVVLARDPDDIETLMITVTATGEVIRFVGVFFDIDAARILRFANGSEIDVASLEDLPVIGTNGADLLKGDSYATPFLGGTGDDTLRGEGGDDIYIYRAGDGRDVIDERAARDVGDTLVLDGFDIADAAFERNGAAGLKLTLGAGQSVRIIDALLENLAGVEVFEFDDGILRLPDVLALLGEAERTGFDGNNDVLIGDLGQDAFDGGTGNDLFLGNGGRDRVILAAGDGQDTLQGFAGGPLGTLIELNGSPFADFDALMAAAVQSGGDVVIDLGGGDSLRLTGALLSDLDAANFGFAAAPIAGAGVLTGTLGGDVLQGDGSANTITGRAGSDHIEGRGGNDTAILRDGDGIDSILGGSGYDQVTYIGFGGVTANLAAGTLSGTGILATLASIEGITSGDGNDSVTGSVVTNGIDLGLGDDTAAAGGGADYVFGGDGNDRLNGQAGNDLLSGTAGNDILNGGDGGDDLFGGIGSDSLTGAAGSDALFGGLGSDQLDGGAGVDRLQGGLGADTVKGGSGADIYIYASASEGGDVLLDFLSGTDSFELDAAGFGLTAGSLNPAMFQSSTADMALTAAVRLLFETDTGILRFDADGNGSGNAVILATLQPGASLVSGDFDLI